MSDPIRRRSVLLPVLCALLLLALGGRTPASALTLSGEQGDAVAVTDGAVNAIAKSGTTTYLGGRFSYFGPHTGSGAPIDPDADGRLGRVGPVAMIDGRVDAVVGDGAGGWFVGGEFARVGDRPRANLVRITPSGEVDRTWTAEADGAVHALALSPDRSTLYVGGAFATVAGAARERVAALDATSGAATSWNPGADGAVETIVLDDGAAYLAGTFTHVNGRPRNRLAILDAETATVDACAPDPNGPVLDLAFDGDVAYVAGAFSQIGAASRPFLAAYDLVHCKVSAAWVPTVQGGAVHRLIRDGSRLYLAGAFTTVAGYPRRSLATVRLGTSTVESWNPGADATVEQIELSGDTLFAAGEFATIAGAARMHLAALDPATGTTRPMDVKLSDSAQTLALQNGRLFAGGRFASAGGVERRNLAALDADGRVTAWNPRADDAVYALVTDGTTVWAGGAFGSIGGTGRWGLAAITAGGGDLVTRFWPGLSAVYALQLSPDGSTLYAGGSFTRAATQDRRNLAAFDVNGTGEPTAWDPRPNNVVRAFSLSPDGSTLYVGGEFTTIAGQARGSVAAFTRTDHALTAWNPRPVQSISEPGRINALHATAETVYIGGRFTWISGDARDNLAEVSSSSMYHLTHWAPNPDWMVEAIDVSATTVRVTGGFSQLGGATRHSLGAVRRSDGTATSWRPDAVNVRTLARSGATLHVGGYIYGTSGTVRGLSAFSVRAAIAPTPERVAAGARVAFDGRASHGNGPELEQWTWTFGDGRQATGAQASHAFTQAGTYTVMLTVRDSDGVTARETRTIAVDPVDDGRDRDRDGGGGGDGELPGPGVPGGPNVPDGPRAPEGPGGEQPTERPAVSGVRVSPQRVRAGRAAAVRIAFRSATSATIRVTFAREAAGRRSRGRCVAPTRRLRRAASCTRLVALPGALSAQVGSGPGSVRFSGRLGGRALAAGRYRVTVQATDAAGRRSAPASTVLTVQAARR